MKEDTLYGNIATAPILHGHYKRPRIDRLFEEAIAFPLIIVTAGVGYGKTQAVASFLDNHDDIVPIWLRLSTLDNFSTRFWESFIFAVSVQDRELAAELQTFGFPDSAPQFYLFLHKISDALENIEHLMIVFDDFYLIKEPSVIHFAENLLNAHLKKLTVILVGRTKPKLDLQGFYVESKVRHIKEADLCFTLDEIVGYFNEQGIELQSDTAQEIYKKTEGWISVIYLILLSLKRKNTFSIEAIATVKQEILALIDQEIFAEYSSELQDLLIKLSFLENTSADVDIIRALSNGSVDLREIEKTNTFIQFNPATQSYRLHQLFYELLLCKQSSFTEEEISAVYRIAAQFYHRRGAIIEALDYYRKYGNYEKIWDIIRFYQIDMPQDEATLFLDLIEEFPAVFLKTNPLIGVIRGRLLLNNGRLEEAVAELTKIKNTFEARPPTPENKAIIGEACIFLAMLSLAMGNYHFVELFKTADQCLPHGSVLVDNRLYLNNGNCSVTIKEPALGEIEKFEQAIVCAAPYASRSMNGCSAGGEYLTLAEAAYFKGDMPKAESNAHEAIYRAQRQQQNDIICVGYFILIRTSIAKGHLLKATDYLNELKERVEKPNSTSCLHITDVIKGWFYAKLGDSDKVADWILKEEQSSEKLSPNRTGRERLVRAYCFLESKNYSELSAFLEYMEEIYSKSFLIPRLQVQIYKAIVAQKTHDKSQFITAFETAYNLAHNNAIIMPFIEMGRHMRAVCDEAKRCENIAIPQDWLDTLYTKASTYAKHLRSIQAQYKDSSGHAKKNLYGLTKREKDILWYLCQGLTRKEIADTLYISTSTVKRTLKDIYTKLGTSNSAETVNLAVKLNLHSNTHK